MRDPVGRVDDTNVEIQKAKKKRSFPLIFDGQ
jgi:hypothetical protein